MIVDAKVDAKRSGRVRNDLHRSETVRIDQDLSESVKSLKCVFYFKPPNLSSLKKNFSEFEQRPQIRVPHHQFDLKTFFFF